MEWFAGDGVYEAQLGGVQSKAWSSTCIPFYRAIGPVIVYLFATNRMAELGEMDADLVCAPGLQPAAQERVCP